LHRVGLKHLNQTAVILGVVVKGLVLVDNLAHCQLRLESSPKTISNLESPTWEAIVYMYWLDTKININERFCDSAKQNEDSITFKFSCSTTVSGGVSVLSTSGIFFFFEKANFFKSIYSFLIHSYYLVPIYCLGYCKCCSSTFRPMPHFVSYLFQ